ncbi:MAG: CapA family protein [Firmicutes bacterium]|nr:CapA family protein [Bacillota bacterium]
MFIVLRGRVLVFHIAINLVIIGVVISVWSWLNAPTPPPRIGISGISPALIQGLLPNTELGKIYHGTPSELLEHLEKGELDYLVELDEPTSSFANWFLGYLVPAIVVPFFDPSGEITMQELMDILNGEPHSVVVSEVLALPGFPWFGLPVRYLPSAEVIQELTTGHGKLGIIPVQDRTPSVRVVPLSQVDPCQPLDPPSTYPLSRTIYLSRAERNLANRLKDRYNESKGKSLDEIRLAALESTYFNPWANQIKFVAVGDIMLDRDVEKVGLQKGWEHIFSEVAPFIQEADLAFANLESPIGDKGRFINMFQAPPEAVQGIAYAGFDVVSLANNHTLDFHIEGMFETMRLLEEHGIDWVGAGQDIHAARSPLIKEIGGIKVGFLSYTEMWFVYTREPISWQATQDEPGVAPARLETIVDDVTKLRDLVDVVIVSVHWGKEYVHEPTAEQFTLARAAVDAGAHLVLGHHPHVLQGIEFYQHGVIAYSLGNFVFDINLPKTWETMILDFTLSPSGVRDLTIVPAYIFGVQPHILQGSHRDAVYRQIRHYSLKLR